MLLKGEQAEARVGTGWVPAADKWAYGGNFLRQQGP